MTEIPVIETVKFENGALARIVGVFPDTPPQVVLESLKFPSMPCGVISISGGATAYPRSIKSRTTELIYAVVNLAFKEQIAIVDGGTETGVMQITGECFARERAMWDNCVMPPLIGFAPAFMVTYPGAKPPRYAEPTPLDSNHPYFVLLQGRHEWGSEVSGMFSFLRCLSQHIPSVAIIANGGLTTLEEALYGVRHGREIIIFEGSKRSAEAIIARMDGKSSQEIEQILYQTKLVASSNQRQVQKVLADLEQIVTQGKITRFDVTQTPETLVDLLTQKLAA